MDIPGNHLLGADPELQVQNLDSTLPRTLRCCRLRSRTVARFCGAAGGPSAGVELACRPVQSQTRPWV